MKRCMVVVMMFLAVCAMGVFGQDLRQTGEYGATHVVIVDYNDFSTTATNTAETLTVSIPAKTGVEFVAMRLLTAFDTSDTNYTGSFAVKVGDGTDDDLYLTSTELASDGTEVWWKFGTANGGTIAVTPQTTTVETDPVLTLTTNTQVVATNLTFSTIVYEYDGSGGLATNSFCTAVTYYTNNLLSDVSVATTTSTVATNATATYTASALGQKVYTAADTIDFVFTPNAEEATSENTAGKVYFYFKLLTQ